MSRYKMMYISFWLKNLACQVGMSSIVERCTWLVSTTGMCNINGYMVYTGENAGCLLNASYSLCCWQHQNTLIEQSVKCKKTHNST